jgi:hypothetical protein
VDRGMIVLAGCPGRKNLEPAARRSFACEFSQSLNWLLRSPGVPSRSSVVQRFLPCGGKISIMRCDARK